MHLSSNIFAIEENINHIYAYRTDIPYKEYNNKVYYQNRKFKRELEREPLRGYL